jgi:hypothetical protein
MGDAASESQCRCLHYERPDTKDAGVAVNAEAYAAELAIKEQPDVVGQFVRGDGHRDLLSETA